MRLGRGGGYYDRFLAHYKGAGLLLCPEALLLITGEGPAMADLRRQANRQTLDADWFHRAKTALRLKQAESARLTAHLSTLAQHCGSHRRERFKDALIAAMRAECDDARWAALLQRARLLHDHQEVSHG